MNKIMWICMDSKGMAVSGVTPDAAFKLYDEEIGADNWDDCLFFRLDTDYPIKVVMQIVEAE